MSSSLASAGPRRSVRALLRCLASRRGVGGTAFAVRTVSPSLTWLGIVWWVWVWMQNVSLYNHIGTKIKDLGNMVRRSKRAAICPCLAAVFVRVKPSVEVPHCGLLFVVPDPRVVSMSITLRARRRRVAAAQHRGMEPPRPLRLRRRLRRHARAHELLRLCQPGRQSLVAIAPFAAHNQTHNRTLACLSAPSRFLSPPWHVSPSLRLAVSPSPRCLRSCWHDAGG